MPTARRLVTNALRTLGVLASGEESTAAEAIDALEILNEMIDLWNLRGLIVYRIDRNLFTVTSGQGTYTLGTGGDWNIPRPVKIDNAFFRETATGLELPARVLTEEEYQGIRLKNTQGSWPRWLYNDYAFPLSTVTVWPVPDISNQMVLYTWNQLTSMATLDTVWTFPPGYAIALRFNLSIALAPEYGKSVSPEIAALASEALAHIQSVNIEVPLMQVDPALTEGQGWDWNTGEVI
jgi:hypothetical protein